MVAIRRAETLAGRFHDVEVGMIKDWMVFDDSVDPLAVVMLAMKTLESWPVDAVMVTSSGLSDAEVSVLKRVGFWQREDLRMSFFAHPSSPLAGDEFRQRDAWHCTEADADGFFL